MAGAGGAPDNDADDAASARLVPGLPRGFQCFFIATPLRRPTGHMNPDIAQALIAAALLASLLFPTLAGLLLSRAARAAVND
jgi:hypothetical protein